MLFLSSICRNIVIGEASFFQPLENRAISLGELFELSNILRPICAFFGATLRIV